MEPALACVCLCVFVCDCVCLCVCCLDSVCAWLTVSADLNVGSHIQQPKGLCIEVIIMNIAGMLLGFSALRPPMVRPYNRMFAHHMDTLVVVKRINTWPKHAWVLKRFRRFWQSVFEKLLSSIVLHVIKAYNSTCYIVQDTHYWKHVIYLYSLFISSMKYFSEKKYDISSIICYVCSFHQSL